MAITKTEVEHVANLARLTLTEKETEQFTDQLNRILQMAEKLNELDTTGIEPTSHVLPMANVMREDEVRPSLPLEKVLLNAPDQKDGLVRVPAVFEG
ncbi:aspartyl/glutamyl-tRNA(Asn/Gln) amidotransferase subunit C [Thermoactinomyces sp. DSM 45891]|uniref:Asp-tRNA(Asn)/Glu-tRNA(Gln) amidotransferase subunit GatC n=1 Tax=Thermoactinomyces sp. DSM 45891 TaxID=1761907 RepID=UPI00091BC5BB|nr:Asp-tRNA(Asn)/Glu-tRNA(Gln) amidotransferase subunit GatC [Thermoactinomyces sp. DSM 45891]SFX19025.1 aspartyl/glutamyl-tRNA(Asn/Gln) amidotransferase subunit C [Thermoactinomyces sp. DSM 45891]